MKNCVISVDGNIMTIKVDLTKNCGMSKSGKNKIIATTGGNQGYTVGDDEEIKIGINIYKAVDE